MVIFPWVLVDSGVVALVLSHLVSLVKLHALLRKVEDADSLQVVLVDYPEQSHLSPIMQQSDRIFSQYFYAISGRCGYTWPNYVHEY